MDRIIKRLQNEAMTRIVAFGSSNTERASHSCGAHNWFDWVDVLVRECYGRVHCLINSGVSGESAGELLKRFDRDVAMYRPHVVLLTVGGNDAIPERHISYDEYRSNLEQIVKLCGELDDCVLIMQTYYGVDQVQIGDEYAKNMVEYMQCIRDVAKETGTLLIDNFARWERLRESDWELFRQLMINSMHVNGLGNMLWGLDVAREFGVELKDVTRATCADGLRYQAMLDDLAAGKKIS